jgi:hypothetical protein
MPIAATLAPGPIRRIVHRSRGRSHGFVTRLMSPGDLGRILKPFAFLDLVDNKGEVFPTFGLTVLIGYNLEVLRIRQLCGHSASCIG